MYKNLQKNVHNCAFISEIKNYILIHNFTVLTNVLFKLLPKMS